MSEVMIRINQIPYRVDVAKKISYDDVLKVTKLPFGSTVFYIDTKTKKKDWRVGFLEKGQDVLIEDGLDISVYTQTKLMTEEEGEAA